MPIFSRKVIDARWRTRSVYGTGLSLGRAFDRRTLDDYSRLRVQHRLPARGSWQSLKRYGAIFVIGQFVAIVALQDVHLQTWLDVMLVVSVWGVVGVGPVLGYFLLNRRGMRVWYPPDVVRAMLLEGRCPSCAHSLSGGRRDSDGCTVCPECGGAWIMPDQRGFRVWLDNSPGASALARGRCPSCGYSLAGVAPAADGCTVCPECGAPWRLPLAGHDETEQQEHPGPLRR